MFAPLRPFVWIRGKYTRRVDGEDKCLHRIKRHASELIRLAIPAIIARMGILLMGFVDTIMVGRFSADELAYQGIGGAPVVVVILTTFGLLNGTMIMTASFFGSGHYEKCGEVWRHSLPSAFVLSLIGLLVCCFGEELLLLTGQTEELAREGGKVIFILGLGMPATVLHFNAGAFLEGIKRPIPGMIIVIIANLLNIFFNWLFIYGNMGFEAMGAVGSAISTACIRVFLAIAVILYIFYMKDSDKFAVRKKPSGGWKSWKLQRKLGYAAGMSLGLEIIAFSSLNIFAGWLGKIPLGAYSISLNIIALVFMIAIGLGASTAVRVGNALGRHDYKDMELAGWVGFGMNTLAMIVCGLVLYSFPEEIALIYAKDAELLEATIPLIAFTSYVLVFDGGQGVLANTLRGRKDAWVPAFMQSFSYMIVLMPSAYIFSIVLKHGAIGLLEGIIVGSVCSVCLLSTRFHILCKRDRLQVEKI